MTRLIVRSLRVSARTLEWERRRLGPDRDLPIYQRSLKDAGFRNYNHRMPAKDVIHDAVKNALVKDGWTITDDPLRLKYKIEVALEQNQMPLIIVRTETEEIVKWKS